MDKMSFRRTAEYYISTSEYLMSSLSMSGSGFILSLYTLTALPAAVALPS